MYKRYETDTGFDSKSTAPYLPGEYYVEPEEHDPKKRKAAERYRKEGRSLQSLIDLPPGARHVDTQYRDWNQAVKDDLNLYGRKAPPPGAFSFFDSTGSFDFDPDIEAALQSASSRAYRELKPTNRHLPRPQWDKAHEVVRHRYIDKPDPTGAAAGRYFPPSPIRRKPAEILIYGGGENQMGLVTHEAGHNIYQPDPRYDKWMSKELKDEVLDEGYIIEEAGVRKLPPKSPDILGHLNQANEQAADFGWEKRYMMHSDYPYIVDEWGKLADEVGPGAAHQKWKDDYASGYVDPQKEFDDRVQWHTDNPEPEFQPDGSRNPYYGMSPEELAGDISNPQGRYTPYRQAKALKEYLKFKKNPEAGPTDWMLDDMLDSWIIGGGADADLFRRSGVHTVKELKERFPKDYIKLKNLMKISKNESKPVGMFTGRSTMPS